MKNIHLFVSNPLSFIVRFINALRDLCADITNQIYKSKKGFYRQSYYEKTREGGKIFSTRCLKGARILTEEEKRKFHVKITENRLFFIGTFISDKPWAYYHNEARPGNGNDDLSIKLTLLGFGNESSCIKWFVDDTKVFPKLYYSISDRETERGYQILDYMKYYNSEGKESCGYVAFHFGHEASSYSGEFLLTYIV